MSEHIVINKDRSVVVPISEKKIGIQYDHNVNKITFDCPRYADDNEAIDMSRMHVFLNYMLPDKTTGCTILENVVVDETDPAIIHFDWVVTRNHTRVKGVMSTLICIKQTDTEGTELYHWNTDLFQQFIVGDGMECGKIVADENPDVITQLLVRMDAVDARTSTEAIQGYVNNYLTEHPVSPTEEQMKQGVAANSEMFQSSVDDYLGRNPLQLDNGLTETTKAAPANKVGEIQSDVIDLKGDIGRLSEEKVENPLTGVVGQILEIETVDESGKPKTYKAVNKPSGGGEVTDEQISNAVDNYMTAHPFTETDPTVPNWAKQPEKPTYTASEVGALPVGTKIPSKTSDLQNDSGFLTYHQDLSDYALKSEVPKSASDVGADASGTAESKVSEHNISDTAHNDIRLLVHGLTERLNALADSDDTTLDQMSEVVAYIKNNKNLIDGITTSKVNVSDIINNLTTNLSNKVLSASMGVELKKLIDAITIPDTLPNPNALTFTGAVTGSYDGSTSLSVNIPSAVTDDHINELINTALNKIGVAEEGVY